MLIYIYLKKTKVDEEENEYSKEEDETFFDYLDFDETEEEKKERIEKRKKELEKLEEDKNIFVLYKPNGKKIYYRLTEELFFNSPVSEK